MSPECLTCLGRKFASTRRKGGKLKVSEVRRLRPNSSGPVAQKRGLRSVVSLTRVEDS